MKYALPIFMFILLVTSTVTLSAQEKVELTIEELRVEKAQQAMPMLKSYFDWFTFKDHWLKVNDFAIAQRAMNQLGDELWQYSKQQVQTGNIVDDRALYWTRLAIQSFIKSTHNNFTQLELTSLIESFEKSSRGYSDMGYVKSTNKRILLTGFDPFLLDNNLKQSNPSGLATLLLDGTVITYHGVIAGVKRTITAEINAVMVPVRYGDFDQGEVENLFAPFYALNSVDLIATMSMGRSDFDLEHFPGLRRSSTAPDNVNVYTGANKTNPLIPNLLAAPLKGDEFVRFSLPYQAMMKTKGSYKINDHRGVTVLMLDKEKLTKEQAAGKAQIASKAKDITANSLTELAEHISVQGAGGGYLSNEISYRSIVLRNKLGSTIPTGHIHTPRISDFDDETNKKITDQIKAMLIATLTEI